MIAGHAGRELLFFDVGDTLVRARRPFDELLVELVSDADVRLPADVGRELVSHIEEQVSQRALDRLPFTFPPGESRWFWFETYRAFFARMLDDREARRLASALRDRLSNPAGYVLYDDTMPALGQLRDAGYRLGIISNWEAWLPELLDMLNLTPLFEHVVISGRCGVEKPDSRIFTLALEQCGRGAESVVHIGDRPSQDVDPAQEVGIRSVLVDRHDRYLDHAAWWRIASLSELPAILG